MHDTGVLSNVYTNKIEYDSSDTNSTTSSGSNMLSESTFSSDRVDMYFVGSGDDVITVGDDTEYPIGLTAIDPGDDPGDDPGSVSMVTVIGVNPTPSIIAKIHVPLDGNAVLHGTWSIFMTVQGLNENVNPYIYLVVTEVDADDNVVHIISEGGRDSTVEVSDVDVYQLEAFISTAHTLKSTNNRLVFEICAISNARTDLEIIIGGGNVGFIRIPTHDHSRDHSRDPARDPARDISRDPNNLTNTSAAFAGAVHKAIKFAVSEIVRLLKKCVADPLFDVWKYLVKLFKYIWTWLTSFRKKEIDSAPCDWDDNASDTSGSITDSGSESGSITSPEESRVVIRTDEEEEEDADDERVFVGTGDDPRVHDVLIEVPHSVSTVLAPTPGIPTMNISNDTFIIDDDLVRILKDVLLEGDTVINGNLTVNGKSSCCEPTFIDVNVDVERVIPYDYEVINLSAGQDVVGNRTEIAMHDSKINGATHRVVNNTGRDMTIVDFLFTPIVTLVPGFHTELFYVNGWRV